MVALVTVLLAFPLGFFVRSRTTAYLAFVAVWGYVFSFQNVTLLRSWIDDRAEVFPRDADALPLDYLLVTAVLYAAGFGLVTLGARIAERRRRAVPAR
jgi:hypothetical protein